MEAGDMSHIITATEGCSSLAAAVALYGSRLAFPTTTRVSGEQETIWAYATNASLLYSIPRLPRVGMILHTLSSAFRTLPRF